MHDDSNDPEAQADGGLTVSEARTMFDEYKSYWQDNYSEAKTDLKFALGMDHWEADDLAARKKSGRVSLVINELPQFIHQVCNDIRQNTPSIKAIPDYDADQETAEIFEELIRAIEYKSAADEIYDTAGECMVTCGIGFIRVDHDYCEAEGDEQEIIIKRVPNPLSVWIDPNSIECDGRDAMGAIVLTPISKRDFKRLYGDKPFISFDDPDSKDPKDKINIAEIFVKEWVDQRGKKAVVHRYQFSGHDLLAKSTFPSQYIPIVPVYGAETWIDGKRYLQSLIRQARDPQRRLNHWASKEAEILAMAPIAPVMAVEGTLVNDRGQWQRPGSEVVLEYKTKDLNDEPAPPPTRLQPPPIPTGIINAMQGAKENIKESMGLYNASIGQRSNETSGVAIDARKLEGDVATYHFPDNLRRAINHVGTIIVDTIPNIYDTPRVLQIVTEEQQPKFIGVNGYELQEGQERPFDLTRGKYHVRVTTGASYTTKRQESAQFLADMFKQSPELMAIGGDLLFKNLDLPGAEPMAARFRKTIDPKLLEDDGQDPRLQQMQGIIQQMQVQLQQALQELQSKKGEESIKAAEIQLKQGELAIKKAELQVKIAELQKPMEDKTLEANQQLFEQRMAEREMALKEAEFQLKVVEALQAQQVQESQITMQPLLGASQNQEAMQSAG